MGSSFNVRFIHSKLNSNLESKEQLSVMAVMKILVVVLTVVPVGPAVVHPEFSISSQDGESVVDDRTKFRVDVLWDVFSSSGSVPGPVDEVADYVLVAL